MKRIIIVTLIAGINGCQDSPSLTTKNFNELSNEDLCRALGTYNYDGESVLKIYDEFKKRPDEVDPERCYALEKIEMEKKIKTSDVKTNAPYTNNIKTNPLHSNNMKEDTLYPNEIERNSSHTGRTTISSLRSENSFYQYTDPQHHKIIHNPRKNNKSNKDKKMDSDDFEKMTSFNSFPVYQNGPYTGEKVTIIPEEMIKDKIDMKEDDLNKLMRECLKRHLSKHHANADK